MSQATRLARICVASALFLTGVAGWSGAAAAPQAAASSLQGIEASVEGAARVREAYFPGPGADW